MITVMEELAEMTYAHGLTTWVRLLAVLAIVRVEIRGQIAKMSQI